MIKKIMLAVVATAVISVGAYFFIVKPGMNSVPSFLKEPGFLLAMAVIFGLTAFVYFNTLKGTKKEKKPVIYTHEKEVLKKSSDKKEESLVSA